MKILYKNKIGEIMIEDFTHKIQKNYSEKCSEIVSRKEFRLISTINHFENKIFQINSLNFFNGTKNKLNSRMSGF